MQEDRQKRIYPEGTFKPVTNTLPPPPPEPPPTRHVRDGMDTKESKAASAAWRDRQKMTFGDIVKIDIAERDAKLQKIRALAYTLIAKNGIDPVACRERDIGLDLVQIIAGDA